MNLKEKLNNLVTKYDMEQGSIEKFANQAWGFIEEKCKTAASLGEKNVKVPISFEGCKGGNQAYVKYVVNKIFDKIVEEGLTCDYNNSIDPQITVSW